jgi:hypothetical protein
MARFVELSLPCPRCAEGTVDVCLRITTTPATRESPEEESVDVEMVSVGCDVSYCPKLSDAERETLGEQALEREHEAHPVAALTAEDFV